MRASRSRRRAAAQYQEPDAADSSPLTSSRSRSSAASLSWSDAETTFDRLLRGQVFQTVKTRANPVNDSSLSCGSDQVPSIRLFESPSAAPPVPPGKAARRRGKENRVSTAYGRAAKRSGPGVAPVRPSTSVAEPGTAADPPSLSADGPSLSANLRSGGAAPAAAARLLAGPSTSTPVPGRLWSATPLLSPVPPGVAAVSPGASPQLAASASLSASHGGAAAAGSPGTEDRLLPPRDSDAATRTPPALSPTALSPLPLSPPPLSPPPSSPAVPEEESEMEQTSVPPVLSPAADATPPSLQNSSLERTPPPPRLSFALDRTPVLPREGPAAELVPPPVLGRSQPVDVSDVSMQDGLPVDMLPRYRSEVFSSDEEEPPAAPPRRARGSASSAAPAGGGGTGVSASRSGEAASPAEVKSDISRFADSAFGAEVEDVLEDSARSGTNGSSEGVECITSRTHGKTSGSPAGGHSSESPLPSCFVRLDRLSSEELGRAAVDRADADAAGCGAGDPSSSEGETSRRLQPPVANVTESRAPAGGHSSESPLPSCFVRLDRLSSEELGRAAGDGVDAGGAGYAEGDPSAGEDETSRRSQLSVANLTDCFVRLCHVEASADGGVSATEAEAGQPGQPQETPAGDGSVEEMEVDGSGGGRADEEHGIQTGRGAIQSREDGGDMSLPSIMPLASPETDAPCRPAADAAPGLRGVLLALRSGKGWRRSLCQLDPAVEGRAAPGRLSVPPLTQLAEEEEEEEDEDRRGLRAASDRRRSMRLLHSLAEEEGGDEPSVQPRLLRSGRRSIQPQLEVEPAAGYSGRLRSLRGGRRSMVTFRELPEEEEGGESAEDSSGDRQLRSGGRSVLPLREEPEEEDSKAAGTFRSLRSGHRPIQPVQEAPSEEETDLPLKSVGPQFRPVRSGRRSMQLLCRQSEAEQAEPESQAGARAQTRHRRRSVQPHRQLSQEEYSKALAALRSLRDALPALPTAAGPRQPEETVEQATAGDAHFTSPPLGRQSGRVSGVAPPDSAPTPRRRSVLPVGFSPAPKFRRSSVYVSTDAAAAGAGAAVGDADVSLSYDDPAGRVLELCGLLQPASFVQYCRRAKVTKKIGEGVYGEVFLCETKTDRSVIKIMPIEGDFEVNDAAQKSYGEVLSELLISKSLSDLHAGSENAAEGFVRLLSSHVVRGAYPARLSKLWDQFDRDKGSENEHPRLFPASQLFLVLEYSHAGADLENFEFRDVDQAIASFYQIAFSLAVGEAALEFEHRDLHWGNVLLRAEPAVQLPGQLRGRRYLLPTAGLRATLIDFTLSRLRADGAVVYNNLAEDPTLFNAHGDHQFEVYRQMRAATDDRWRQHCPITNVQWLYYVADKMCAGCAYSAGGSRQHRQQLRRLHQLRQQVNSFSSATELVETLCRDWLEG